MADPAELTHRDKLVLAIAKGYGDPADPNFWPDAHEERVSAIADAVEAHFAALTPTHSAEDAAVLDEFCTDCISLHLLNKADKHERYLEKRAAVLARMAGKVPEGSVVLPKQAIEALYMRLWARHEHLDDGPPDFEPVRQPWTPDDDAALKAVAKYLFAAPEAPR